MDEQELGRALIQHLDKHVKDLLPHYSEEFYRKVNQFLLDVIDNERDDIGELRIYDLTMAIKLAIDA